MSELPATLDAPFPFGVYTVTALPNGDWPCCCDQPKCKKIYPKKGTFQQHVYRMISSTRMRTEWDDEAFSSIKLMDHFEFQPDLTREKLGDNHWSLNTSGLPDSTPAIPLVLSTSALTVLTSNDSDASIGSTEASEPETRATSPADTISDDMVINLEAAQDVDDAVEVAVSVPAQEISLVEPIRDSQLQSHPFLANIGMSFNQLLRLVICLDCGVAITSKSIVDHLHDCHSDITVRIQLADVASVVEELGVLDSYDKVTLPEPCPQIEGLPLKADGLACTVCGHIRGSRPSMQTHFAVHPETPFPTTLEEVVVQQLHHRARTSFFRVHPTLAPSSGSELTEYLDELEAVRQKSVKEFDQSKVDPRQVSPWLRATRWHEHIAGYDQAHLRSLVALPTKAEPHLEYLAKIIEKYTQLCNKAIDNLSTITLQIINSPIAGFGNGSQNNTPFGHHLDLDKSLHKYSLELVKLFAFLLRPSDQYSHGFPDSFKLHLKTLEICLEMKDEEEALVMVHEICLVLFGTEWEEDSAQTMRDPTIRYLMLSQLKAPSGFNTLNLTPPVIAKLEYILRLTYVNEIWRLKSNPEEESSTFELAKELSTWFTEHRPSTFNSLRTLTHLASSISYGTMSLPRIWWTDRQSYRTLLYNGSTVSMDNITQMQIAMEKDMVRIWEEDLLHGLKLRVNYSKLVDVMVSEEVGYSFLSDEGNRCFRGTQRLLIDAIMGTPELRTQYLKGFRHDGQPIWNPMAFRKWLIKYGGFQLIAFGKAETTAGSPSRATELSNLLFKNTISKPHRNLFIVDGNVYYLAQYHKGSAISGLDKMIPHAFDGFTSDMIIQDLAIARPFAQLAGTIVFPEDSEIHRMYDCQLFVNFARPFTTSNLTTCLQEYSLAHIGCKIGVNAWRHISIAFRRKLATNIEDLLEADGRETIGAAQAHHSRHTENFIYGITSEALKSGNAEDIFPLFLDHSKDWQIVCGVFPGGALLPYSQCMAEDFVAPPKAKSETTELVEQVMQGVEAKLKPLVQDTVKGAVTDALKTVVSDAVKEALSSLRFALPTANSIELPLAPEVTADEDTMVISQSNVLQGPISSPKLIPAHEEPCFSEDDALGALRQVLKKPDATWTSALQRDAVMTVLNMPQDLVAIMTTGSGKSMLAIIPAVLDKEATTVLVLPLKSLITDFKRKLDTMEVPYFHYVNNTAPRGYCSANLVIVSIDISRTPHYKQWISELHMYRPARRILKDEAHYPLTDADFRDCFKNIDELRCLPCPLILLSGTIPPRCQPEIISMYGLDENVKVIRSISTNRPELQLLRAPKQDRKQVIKAVCALWTHHHKTMKPEDRALIYVPWKDLGEAIRDALKAQGTPCDLYWSKETDSVKEDIYRRWRAGGCQVMVSTSAFSAGNDYPHVRLVIHAGTPREMINYIQEISRGGRDGLQTFCYLMPTSMWNEKSAKPNDALLGVTEMKRMNFEATDCLRFEITSFNDGLTHGVRCRDLSTNQLCSVCSHLSSEVAAFFQSGGGLRVNLKRAPQLPPSSDVRHSKAFKPDTTFTAPTAPARPVADSVQKAYERTQAKQNEAHKQELSLRFRLEKKLEVFYKKCAMCYWMETINDTCREKRHEFTDCKFFTTKDATQYVAWKSLIVYGKHHTRICFTCHVPNIAGKLHDEPFGMPNSCRYLDVVLPTLYFAYTHRREELEAQFNVRWRQIEDYAAWLSGKPVNPDLKSNLMSVFAYMIHAD